MLQKKKKSLCTNMERHTRSVQKLSSHIIWKIETFIEGDTRYQEHYTYDNDVSVSFKVGTLGPHTVLPVAISCPVGFSGISLMIWNLFPFKDDFRKKPEVTGHQIWAVEGLSHLGDLLFCQKTLHETWCMRRHIVLMKLPITSCP